MTCPAITIPSVDAAEWERLKIIAQQRAGVRISADSGEYRIQGAYTNGFRVSWLYVPDASALTIQVLDHPPFISCDYINSMIAHGISLL